MNFPAILFIVLTTHSELFLQQIKADTSLLCTPCNGPDCEVTYGTCFFGTYRNFCGQQECAKGPNQTCGGMFDQRGRCGDGLSCRCNVCSGCSTDSLVCYNNIRCRPDHHEEPLPVSLPMPLPRPLPRPDHYPFATLG